MYEESQFAIYKTIHLSNSNNNIVNYIIKADEDDPSPWRNNEMN